MRLPLVIIFALLSFLSHGQEREPIQLKKSWMVGGNAKLFVEKLGNQTGRLIVEVDPSAAYFVTEYLALGMRFPLSFTSDGYRIALNPFVRSYLPTKCYVRPFVEVNAGHNWWWVYDNNGQEYGLAQKNWLFGSQLGAAFFLHKKVSIDIYSYYTGQKSTNIQQGKETDGGFYHNIGFGVGFQVYL